MSYSYDDVYVLYAWRDNRRHLVLTQGEGYSGTLTNNDVVKAPRFQLKDERGVIAIPTSGNPIVQLAVTRSNRTEDLLTCVVEDSENGIIYCPITKSLSDIAGDIKGEIRLITANAVTKFYGVDFYVFNGVSDSAAAQSTQFSDLVHALQKVINITGGGTVADMDDVIEHGGLNPVASGVIYDYLMANFTQYKNPGDAYINNSDNHLDSNTVYKYGTGLLVQANGGNYETQYYFAADGKLRYRTRTKTGDTWDNWVSQNEFSVFETKDNKTTTLDNSSTDQQYPTAKVVYDKTIRFKTIYSTELFNSDTHLDPQTIYRYGAQGLIIASNSSSQETQYYFAQDGVLRYRYRIKSGDTWGVWVDGDNFYSIINQENLENNLFPYISPQNKLDKYFVKTCIDKSKVKLNKYTQILGFGDSIMATSDGGSWLDILQEKIDCPAPYNYAIGNAHFSNNNYNGTRLITKLNQFLTYAETHINDVAKINLIVVAGGTNDAKNGTPINTFKTDVNEFFTSLIEGFQNLNIDCPPVLVITPIRRGSEAEINAKGDNNLEIKISKYSAVLNNLALQKGFSVLNGFDIPVLVDDMTIEVGANSTTITSFMHNDSQHVHPNSTTGRTTYAQAVIDMIGFEPLDSFISSNSTNPVIGKIIYDYLVDVQAENDKRFALHLSVGFNENGIPIKYINSATLSAGDFTGSNITTAFIGSNVRTIDGGAFANCQNLTDVYIDNKQESVTIVSGAFPNGVTIHYMDGFNYGEQIISAVKYLNTVKANAADVYTKSEVNQKIIEEVSKVTTYKISVILDKSVWDNNIQSIAVLSPLYTINQNTQVTMKLSELAKTQLDSCGCESISVETVFDDELEEYILTFEVEGETPTTNITVDLWFNEVVDLTSQ